MFSSCAELVITGDSKVDTQMRHTIALVIDGFGFKPKAFKMLEDGRAVLYDTLPENKYQAGLIEITKENCNASFILALIKLWLQSSNYSKSLFAMPKFEGDGGYYEGWRMTLDNRNIDEKIIFEPWWAFYHK